MATFTVTKNNDDGTAGTLRNAIDQSQDGDDINFADGLGTITVGTPLYVTTGVTIDGGGDITVSAAGSNQNNSARQAGVFEVQGIKAPITIKNITIDSGNAQGAKGATGASGTQGAPGAQGLPGRQGGAGGTGGQGQNAAGASTFAQVRLR